MRPRIDELELWDVIASLREHGYGVIRNAGPPSLWDELREGIHALSTPTGTASANGIVGSAPLLLGRHPAVDRVATLPKVMAIAEFSCGKAMRAGRFVGSIKHEYKGEGDGALGLHADQNWMPVPFPEHNLVMTFCFACEGMTRAGGATCVVPRLAPVASAAHAEGGRDRRARRRRDGEGRRGRLGTARSGTAPCRARSRARAPSLHATYQRLYTQPIDDFTYLLKDEAYMASAPEGMRQLLGAELFFHTATPDHDVDMKKFMYAAAAAKI